MTAPTFKAIKKVLSSSSTPKTLMISVVCVVSNAVQAYYVDWNTVNDLGTSTDMGSVLASLHTS